MDLCRVKPSLNRVNSCFTDLCHASHVRGEFRHTPLHCTSPHITEAQLHSFLSGVSDGTHGITMWIRGLDYIKLCSMCRIPTG